MLIAFFAVVGIIAQSNLQPDDAPFTVVSATATRSGSEVIVSIGTDSSRARLLRNATVVTGSAAVPATLAQTNEVCEDVCPDEEDSGWVCHFEAVVHTARAVGDAIAVLPGTRDVRKVTALSAGREEKIFDSEKWNAPNSAPNVGSGYRWTQFPDGVYLTFPPYGRDFYDPPIALSACTTRAVPPFTVLACAGAELLYEGRTGITASLADYGEESARPIARIELDGRDAFLVRLGLTAEVVIALLVKENGKWRLTYREVDYPLMC